MLPPSLYPTYISTQALATTHTQHTTKRRTASFGPYTLYIHIHIPVDNTAAAVSNYVRVYLSGDELNVPNSNGSPLIIWIIKFCISTRAKKRPRPPRAPAPAPIAAMIGVCYSSLPSLLRGCPVYYHSSHEKTSSRAAHTAARQTRQHAPPLSLEKEVGRVGTHAAGARRGADGTGRGGGRRIAGGVATGGRPARA